MGNGNSVAPKERVNIVYKSAARGTREAEELPLKLLVLGDFTRSQVRRPLDECEPIRIDSNNFNEAMERQQVSLSLVVPNRLSDESGSALRVTIPIRTLDDFSADHIASSVPALKHLLEFRKSLRSLRKTMAENPELGRKIESCIKDEAMQKRLVRELRRESNPGDKGL